MGILVAHDKAEDDIEPDPVAMVAAAAGLVAGLWLARNRSLSAAARWQPVMGRLVPEVRQL